MAKIRRILVAVKNPQAAPQFALAKAGEIARALDASVELFHAIADPVITDSLRHGNRSLSRSEAMQRILDDRLASLNKLTRAKALARVRCSTHVAWDFPAHEAIARRALEIPADLVVLESLHHMPGANWVMTHSDWELIKSCHCPLLLARDKRKYTGGVMIASIDPLHSHDKPAALDHELLRVGASLANALDASLEAAHAYLPLSYHAYVAPGEPAAPVWLPPKVENAHRDRIAKELTKVAGRHRIARNRQHLVLGDAAREIPALAKRKRASLVIMGAVSRRGLSRLFVGHTAQRALNQMPCDVLVIKPKSFKAQVPRNKRTVGPIIGFTVY
jgi:universal stress protein E